MNLKLSTKMEHIEIVRLNALWEKTIRIAESRMQQYCDATWQSQPVGYIYWSVDIESSDIYAHYRIDHDEDSLVMPLRVLEMNDIEFQEFCLEQERARLAAKLDAEAILKRDQKERDEREYRRLQLKLGK